ncbi:MAG: hypothetical protein R3F34_17720 [Planctomycetota bacterium]
MKIRSIALAALAPLALAATATAQPVGALGGAFSEQAAFVASFHGKSGSTCKPVPCAKKWVAGHYEVRMEHVTIPAVYRKEWCEAHYRYDYDACGHVVKVLVTPGHFVRVVVSPERVECRQVRVWVPGHFA